MPSVVTGVLTSLVAHVNFAQPLQSACYEDLFA